MKFETPPPIPLPLRGGENPHRMAQRINTEICGICVTKKKQPQIAQNTRMIISTIEI